MRQRRLRGVIDARFVLVWSSVVVFFCVGPSLGQWSRAVLQVPGRPPVDTDAQQTHTHGRNDAQCTPWHCNLHFFVAFSISLLEIKILAVGIVPNSSVRRNDFSALAELRKEALLLWVIRAARCQDSV